MRAKALRLPDSLLLAVKFAEKREKLDEPTTLRKFLRIGAERYVAESYARGETTLREVAKVLDISLREVLEFLWDTGITGNVSADQTIKAISLIETKIANPKNTTKENSKTK